MPENPAMTLLHMMHGSIAGHRRSDRSSATDAMNKQRYPEDGGWAGFGSRSIMEQTQFSNHLGVRLFRSGLPCQLLGNSLMLPVAIVTAKRRQGVGSGHSLLLFLAGDSQPVLNALESLQHGERPPSGPPTEGSNVRQYFSKGILSCHYWTSYRRHRDLRRRCSTSFVVLYESFSRSGKCWQRYTSASKLQPTTPEPPDRLALPGESHSLLSNLQLTPVA